MTGTAGQHEIRRVTNPGNCGVCPEFDRYTAGCRLACITCRVRLCRHTDCWHLHTHQGKGKRVPATMNSKAVELAVSEDQGEKKEVASRARLTEPPPRLSYWHAYTNRLRCIQVRTSLTGEEMRPRPCVWALGMR